MEPRRCRRVGSEAVRPRYCSAPRYSRDVADEHVFTVAGATAVPATPMTLSEAGFTERNHLQEWVIAHPEMLGPGVMIVTLEFDQWRSSAGRPNDIHVRVDRGAIVIDNQWNVIERASGRVAAPPRRKASHVLDSSHAAYHRGLFP